MGVDFALVMYLLDFVTLKKMDSFESPGGALKQSNKHSQIIFMDCLILIA